MEENTETEIDQQQGSEVAAKNIPQNLGRLERVDLRSIWKDEAKNFTPWLAEPDNLELLGQEIGVEFDTGSIVTEARVGDNHYADIMVDTLHIDDAEKTISAVIENQLEKTNHDHLGKLITYMAGLENIRYAIWVTPNPIPAHKSAIEWLNDKTNDSVDFFLVKIEAWRIGSSNTAPKFEVISSPDEWKKVVHRDKNISAVGHQQINFWEQLKNHIKAKGLNISINSNQQWASISIGSSKGAIDLTINSQKNLVKCQLNIRDWDLWDYMMENRDRVESTILNKNISSKEEIEWTRAKTQGILKISKTLKTASFMETERFDEEDFTWLCEGAELVKTLFREYLVEFENIDIEFLREY